jgi:hypothetical protein
LTTRKLKNCDIAYLFFHDDIQMIHDYSFGIDPLDSLGDLCSYSYSGERLASTTGGFIPLQPGSSYSDFVFTRNAYDSLFYSNSKIYVYEKYKAGYNIYNIHNQLVFSLNEQNHLVKINIKDILFPDGYDYNYNYSDNQITETHQNNEINRIFYFENNNLVKVTEDSKDNQGLVRWKKEILFQEYDNKPNPFKNMYFVKGAFFRAFSENNYQRYTVSEYFLSNDSIWGETSTYSCSKPILYDSYGYPKFGDYE